MCGVWLHLDWDEPNLLYDWCCNPSIAARLPSKAPSRKWRKRDVSMDPASIPKEDKLMIEIAAIGGKVNGLVEPLEELGHLPVEQASPKG